MDYLKRLLSLKKNFSVKVIKGVGSSELLRQFADELKAGGVEEREIIFVDCKSTNFARNYGGLYELVSTRTTGMEKFFLLVDEAERVSECEKALNALFANAPADIYVTSSSELLVEKILTLLPDKCDVLRLYPPSLPELAAQYPNVSPEKILERYLRYGSLPVTVGPEEKFLPAMLRGVMNELMYSLAERNSIHRLEVLRLVFEMLADGVGTAITMNALFTALQKRGLPIHSKSSRMYFNVCMSFFENVERFDLRRKKILPDRIFCIDNGLLNALRNFSDIDDELLKMNALAIELLRRGYDVQCTERRVDFIARRDGEKNFIKVVLGDKKIFSLRILKFMSPLTDGKKILITERPQEPFADVKTMTFQEFLMGGELN